MSILSDSFMSLSDIAALADVQRPVVTVWRNRPQRAGVRIPFPRPAAKDNTTELFRAEEAVAWLELTGRGNNADPRSDAAAYVRLPTLRGAMVSPYDAAEALLCLQAGSGSTLYRLDPDDLLDLAEEYDPDDEVLFREIEAAGEGAPGMASYVERLREATFGAAGALTVIDRRRPSHRAEAQQVLACAARQLVGHVVAVIALDLGVDTVTLLDPTGDAADLVDAAVEILREGVDVEIAVRGGSERARSARRRHLIRGRRLATGTGSPRLMLVRLLSDDDRAPTPAQVLEQVDDLQLGLTDVDRAVIVGPSAALCDALADRGAEEIRDNVLRLGRLRCAVRLPKGMLAGEPNRTLGLWVLGPEAQGVPVQDRWTTTADLADEPIDGTAASDLATDVLASLGSRQVLHGFRYARPVQTSQILAAGGRLVDVGARPARRRRASSEDVLTLRKLAAEGGVGKVVQVDPADAKAHGPVTLEQAMVSGAVRVLPGTRLGGEPLPAGTLRLFSAASLEDGGTPTGVDAFEFTRRHPQALRTEPGDVVFVVHPLPQAVVDELGLAVVAYPARVLRLRPQSGLVAPAVSRAINAMPPGSRAWRGWQVPRVSADQEAGLVAVLQHAQHETNRLRARLAALDELAERVAGVVSQGTVTVSLSSAESHGKHENKHEEER